MFSDLLWMRLDITISVLLKFSEILLALSHWTKLERSGQLSIATSNIYIYIRNSRDPNIESWGMPYSILESSDSLLLTAVNCCLFVK